MILSVNSEKLVQHTEVQVAVVLALRELVIEVAPEGALNNISLVSPSSSKRYLLNIISTKTALCHLYETFRQTVTRCRPLMNDDVIELRYFLPICLNLCFSSNY